MLIGNEALTPLIGCVSLKNRTVTYITSAKVKQIVSGYDRKSQRF